MRAVIDTNVLFEGITKQGGDCGLLVEAWRVGLLQACVSNTLALEYEDVLARKLSPGRWQALEPLLQVLLMRAERVTTYYTWRPSSPDPGDEHVIDCALTAGAPVVTFNGKDFRAAQKSLGLVVMTPAEAVVALADQS